MIYPEEKNEMNVMFYVLSALVGSQILVGYFMPESKQTKLKSQTSKSQVSQVLSVPGSIKTGTLKFTKAFAAPFSVNHSNPDVDIKGTAQAFSIIEKCGFEHMSGLVVAQQWNPLRWSFKNGITPIISMSLVESVEER